MHAGLGGGGRDLLADEARADDDQAAALGQRGAQRAGVLERAQRVDVGEPVEQRQAARAAAGGDEQLLVAEGVAVVERDDAPRAVEGRGAGAEEQLDARGRRTRTAGRRPRPSSASALARTALESGGRS